MAFIRVASLDELWIGDMIARVVDGRRIVIVRLDDAVYAFEDRCSHLGVPLSQGCLEGAVLTCSAHHYQYDVHTGCGINPRSARLTSFPVDIEGADVFVDAAAPRRPDGGGEP